MLSTQEAAKVLGVHVQTIRRWIKEGKVKAMKIGHTIRIADEEVERLRYTYKEV